MKHNHGWRSLLYNADAFRWEGLRKERRVRVRGTIQSCDCGAWQLVPDHWWLRTVELELGRSEAA